MLPETEKHSAAQKKQILQTGKALNVEPMLYGTVPEVCQFEDVGRPRSIKLGFKSRHDHSNATLLLERSVT